MGVPDEAAEVASIVVQTLFDEIGKTIAADSDGTVNYEAEGKAIA